MITNCFIYIERFAQWVCKCACNFQGSVNVSPNSLSAV